MKRFGTFGEYMFDLLFAPLKRGKRAANQFYIFFKVVGRIFDGMKKDVFRVRSEANVASASPVMLPVHGQDRDMPRLEGEDVESYRTRLSMKGVISEWSGTKTGILYALAALGYEESTIQPFSYQGPERWAEFIVFLKGSKQSGINNLTVIDAEVRKVKEGSSKPAYGAEAGNGIEGRVKSAVGIGALMADGIGDTIRVSLTEAPEHEIPVAQLLVRHFADRPGVFPVRHPEPVSYTHLTLPTT